MAIMIGPAALVTGAASQLGIGYATGLALLERGYSVALVDVDAAALRETGADLGALHPGKVETFECDVSSTASVAAALERVRASFGRLDVLVNNAGLVDRVETESMSDELWQKLMDVDLTGVFKCSRAAFPMLCDSGTGAIVNVSSVSAVMPSPDAACYAAAKAGVEGFTRALAVGWSPYGIRVNAVAPGSVTTGLIAAELAAGLVTQDRIDLWARRALPGRFADPSEVASAIAFLASSDSSYITGEVLRVDGGMSVNGRTDSAQ
jgi:NAD(P)-dependent dehydrogenase (short-subunit alcohol dehydrogenase family)